MQRVIGGGRRSGIGLPESNHPGETDSKLFGNALSTSKPQLSRVDPAPSSLFPTSSPTVEETTREKTSHFVKKNQELISKASRNWHFRRDEQTGTPFETTNLENMVSVVLRGISKHNNTEESIQVFNFLIDSLCGMHREKHFTLSETCIANIVGNISNLRSTNSGFVDSWHERLSEITGKKITELNSMQNHAALIAEQIKTYRATGKLPERIVNTFVKSLSPTELDSIFRQDAVTWNISLPLVMIMLNKLLSHSELTKIIEFYCSLPTELQHSQGVLRPLIKRATTKEELMSIYTRLPEAAKNHPDVVVARLNKSSSEEEWMSIYNSLPEAAKNYPDVAVARLRRCSSKEQRIRIYDRLYEASKDDPKVVLVILKHCSSKEEAMNIYEYLSEATKHNTDVALAMSKYSGKQK